MTVSFTDEGRDVMLAKGYMADKSEFGDVYYPQEGIVIPDEIRVNYVTHPWITCFEVEGIQILKKSKGT